jgi:hypothetical protein
LVGVAIAEPVGRDEGIKAAFGAFAAICGSDIARR